MYMECIECWGASTARLAPGEDATSKRPRADAADEEERLRVLREAQVAALEGARKTTQVATLLGVPWGEPLSLKGGEGGTG